MLCKNGKSINLAWLDLVLRAILSWRALQRATPPWSHPASPRSATCRFSSWQHPTDPACTSLVGPLLWTNRTAANKAMEILYRVQRHTTGRKPGRHLVQGVHGLNTAERLHPSICNIWARTSHTRICSYVYVGLQRADPDMVCDM